MRINNIIISLVILLFSIPVFADGDIDPENLFITRQRTTLRLGITGYKMFYTGDSELNDKYTGFGGAFIDWNFYRGRKLYHSGFDLFTRFGFRHFETELEESNPFSNGGMINVFSSGAGIRYNYGFQIMNSLLQIFASVHGEVVYAHEKSKEGSGMNHFISLGVVGGAGFEFTPLPEAGFFAECNYGYAPVGSEKSNIEGLQVYVGASYRKR